VVPDALLPEPSGLLRYITFAGWRLSKVGLGTSQFANPGWGYGADYSPQQLVRQALSLGVTHFDTTDIYGAGGSERVLGASLADVEGVMVASSFFNVAPSSRLLVARARASAKRLGRRLDLCYVLWPNPLVSDRPLMAGMRQLRKEGLMAEVGVSDYDLDRWQTAEHHLGSPILVNQALYNLLRRDAEDTLLPWAATHGRLVVVAQPLATGLLSGAYHEGKRVSGPWRAGSRLFSSENLQNTKELVELAGEVARAHDATVAQVALAYVLRHENVVAIPGAATPRQLAENVAATDLDLSDDEWRGLADAAKSCGKVGVSQPQSRLRAGAFFARDFVGSARHWGRGAALLAATAREDLRRRRNPDGPVAN
jgi:aryl-alcohol dehydrogenase-like predicted oxidoreductase